MSNNKGNMRTFSLDYTSDETGENWRGQFTTKRLGVMDNAKIARRRSELCGGMYCVRDENGKPTGQGIDAWSEIRASIIATLEICLVQKPEWWDIDEITSEGLLTAVYEEVMSFEDSFRRRGRTADKGSDGSGRGEADSAKEHPQTLNDHNAPQMVDEEIPITLDA